VLDAKIIELVRSLMAAERELRRDAVELAIATIRGELNAKGAWNSGRALKEVRRYLVEELRARGMLALGTLQRVHSQVGAPLSDTLVADLKQEANNQIGEDAHGLNKVYMKTLEHMEDRLVRRYELTPEGEPIKAKVAAELDLYVVGLTKKTEQAAANAQSVVTITGPVGAVQTGVGAVAHVAQNLAADDRAALAAALTALMEQLKNANDLDTSTKQNVEVLVQESQAELHKEKPALARLSAFLSGTAGTIQTVGSLQPAYQVLKTALIPLGILLP